MNHFRRIKYEQMLARIPELELECKAMRRDADKLPKRFWAKRRALRARANEIAQTVRGMKRETEMIRIFG